MGKVYRPSLDRPMNGTDQYPMPPCTEVDPNLFTDWNSRHAARDICMSCPFLKACRESALKYDDDLVGVWGGWTPEERRARRKLIACRPVGK